MIKLLFPIFLGIALYRLYNFFKNRKKSKIYKQCPCCDFFSLQGDDYEICKICYWENDGLNLNELDIESGANQNITLREARENFSKFGACHKGARKFVCSLDKRKQFKFKKRKIKKIDNATESGTDKVIEELYSTFKKYPKGNDFCEFCYSKKDIDYYMSTPVRNINVKRSRTLFCEVGDHWDSASVYKHYLPKILEIMLPPIQEEALFPSHILETLDYHNFKTWPANEKQCVLLVLQEVKKNFSYFDEEDEQEWNELFPKLL